MKDNSKQYLQFYSHQYTLFIADMQISNYGFRITRSGQKTPFRFSKFVNFKDKKAI